MITNVVGLVAPVLGDRLSSEKGDYLRDYLRAHSFFLGGGKLTPMFEIVTCD